MARVKGNSIRLLAVILFVGVIGFGYAFYESKNIQFREFVITHKDIPFSFDGKKIIFLADLHCNQYFTPEDVSELVKKINELSPDVILLGGDYTLADSKYSTPFFEALKYLKSSNGIFYVLGNHDFWEDENLIKEGFSSLNIQACDNRSYWVYEGNDSIKIGGVGDMWEDVQLPENTISDVVESDFCILLSHNPDYIEQIDESKVDLMLSGHTHAGQVTIFGLYAPIMPTFWRPHLYDSGQEYRYGWKLMGKTMLYTTSGVGVGDFPFRFFAPPEVVEITLKRQTN